MPSTSKAPKPTGKKSGPPKSSGGKVKNAIQKTQLPVESSEEDDSDDEGVDEEGLTRLMNALGEDGLDEFEQAQLQFTLGEDEDWGTDEEGEDEEDEDGSEVEAGEEEEEDEVENDGSGDEKGADEDIDKDDEQEDLDVDEEEEQDIALDDVESVDEDAVPRQKIEIDDKIALERIRDTIQLDPSFPWTETLVLSYPETIDVNVEDDLNRELAFYKQALHGANAARSLAAKHKFPFTRPADYFAEMVKSDAHMERIRQRLLDESAGIKKSDEKRKEREGKKFGKQVQIEKLKERERGKKEMEERLKGLKRKRGDVLDKPQVDDDAFDVAVEDAISDRPAKRGRGAGGSKITRQSRDQKYGFGGAGKRAKQNTKESTDDFDSGSRRGGRGGARGGARGGGRRGGRGGGRGGFGGGGGRGGGGGGGGNKRLGKTRRMTARSKT